MTGGLKHPQAAPKKKTDRGRISELEARAREMDKSILGGTANALAVLAFGHAVARACGISPVDLLKHFRDVVAETPIIHPAINQHVADIVATLEKLAAGAAR